MHNTLLRSVMMICLLLTLHLNSLSQNNFDNGLLWKISGKDVQDSYIFGTLHLICPDEFIVFPGIIETLEKTNRLVMELDLSDPYIMMGIQMGMFMEDDKELRDIMSKEDFKLVSDFFKDSLEADINFISRIQPLFIVSMIYPHMIQCRPQSYEQFLLQYATDNSLVVLGLETLDEQLNVFKALSYREQANMLVETIREYNSKREEFLRLTQLYLEGDLKGLLDMFKETQTPHPEFNQRLLDDRNHRWIERIELLMQEDATFFALGAGHLPGENGILHLLELAGYTVERIE
jgi:uncharacterized protein